MGGWEVADITHINSGSPLSFSASCNTPGQFRAYGCFPELVPGQRIRSLSQAEINHAIASNANYSAFNIGAFRGADLPIPYQYEFQIPNGPEFVSRGFASAVLLPGIPGIGIARRLLLPGFRPGRNGWAIDQSHSNGGAI